jgi:uncharacterized DUF497 family protein
MDFEWDEAKRRANILKHGIDFVDAIEAGSGRPRIAGATMENRAFSPQVSRRAKSYVWFTHGVATIAG